MTEVTFRNFTPVKSVWISLQSIYSSVPWGILSPHYTDFLIKIYFYNVVSIKVVLALFKVAWAKWADPWVITVITTQESAHATLCSTRKTLVSMVNLTVTWQKIVSISHCESYHTKTYHSWLNLDHASNIFNFNWENSNQFQTRSAHKAARLGQKKVRDSI